MSLKILNGDVEILYTISSLEKLDLMAWHCAYLKSRRELELCSIKAPINRQTYEKLIISQISHRPIYVWRGLSALRNMKLFIPTLLRQE